MQEAEAEKTVLQKTKTKESEKPIKEEGLLITADKIRVWEPVGCLKCDSTGYQGRLGIYEAIFASEKIQSQLVQRDTADNIQRTAIAEQDMLTMQTDGLVKCVDGITSIEEVLRVTRE